MKNMFLMLLTASVLTSQVQAGYKITMKNTSESDAKSRNPQQQGGNSTLCMSTADEKARIDFTEGQMPGAGDGGYLITKDGGKSFYMVSPKEKTYMKWDMDAMMGMAGAVGNMMKMQISDPKVETILDESGDPILGYPTRHFKIRTSYHMVMSVMGFKNETTINKEDETWTTTKLDVSALGNWFNKAPKTQNPELDKLIEAQKGKLTGVPLKMLSVQTSTDNQGKATVTRTSMNVTEIKTISDVPVDIPADYTEMNLFHDADPETPKGKPGTGHGKSSAPKIDFGSLMKKAMESAE
jgi:hypothetical protein